MNFSDEVHEFHIHQLHFLLMAINDVPVPPEQRQLLDTIQVPYGGDVIVRMDFRKVIGDLLYHCHILGHEDNGMMAIVRVLPREEKVSTHSVRLMKPSTPATTRSSSQASN